MQKPSILKTTLSLVAASLLLAGPALSAESLAGKVGTKRYAVQFPPGMQGPCQKLYKDYIAASGHSAYAQTPLSYTAEAFFCGRAFNAPSQKEAEKRALADCNSVGTKYKLKVAGGCEIYVSK
jgi:hypothetical protein